MTTPTALSTYKALLAAHFTDFDSARDFSLISLAANITQENRDSSRSFSWSVALSLCPVAFPANWVHIRSIVRDLPPSTHKDLATLRAAITTVLLNTHPEDEISANRDLFHRGYFASLDHLDDVLSFRVDYEDPDSTTLLASQDLFLELSPDAALLPGVDYAHAFLNTRPSLYHPRGLHSEVLFGPVKNGTCSCGRYHDYPGCTTCTTCGVPVTTRSMRSSASSLLTIPESLGVLSNPATTEPLAYVPVTSPSLRAPRYANGRWVLSGLDRIYTRLLVTFALAERTNSPTHLGILKTLAAADVSQLYAG